ncbi:MAG: DUF2442 domain-containing protein [Candidatus Sericytochromatia bacterium]|nr:DUF2442 domain-containing protein [Candidatus Tanganyikabacteria bacterium]
MARADFDARLERATAAAKKSIAGPTAVREMQYRAVPEPALALTLNSGFQCLVPVAPASELAGASAEQLAKVEVTPLRNALAWVDLDVSIYVPGLLAEILGLVDPAAAGRKGGASRSAAKAAAVRENGKNGGRPRRRPS